MGGDEVGEAGGGPGHAGPLQPCQEVPLQRCYDNNSGGKKMDFSVSCAVTIGLSN